MRLRRVLWVPSEIRETCSHSFIIFEASRLCAKFAPQCATSAIARQVHCATSKFHETWPFRYQDPTTKSVPRYTRRYHHHSQLHAPTTSQLGQYSDNALSSVASVPTRAICCVGVGQCPRPLVNAMCCDTSHSHASAANWWHATCRS